MECDSAQTVKVATMKGMGLGFLYKDYVEFEVNKRELKILKIPELEILDARSFIIYDKRKSLSPLAQDFLHVLHEARVSNIQTTDKKIGGLEPVAGV